MGWRSGLAGPKLSWEGGGERKWEEELEAGVVGEGEL